MSKRIHSTDKYLVLFFKNLILNNNYELKKRYLHINYESTKNNKNVGAKLTKIEQEVLSEIQKNITSTAVSIANQCQVSTRIVERATKSLKEKGIIERIGFE